MLLTDRLRALREAKGFSQGEIEKRTGLLRCYISRVENGHTIPAVETLEKFARALEVPMYQLFYDGKEPPKKLPDVVKNSTSKDVKLWGDQGKEANDLYRFRKLMLKVRDDDRVLVLHMTKKMATRNNQRP